MKDPMEKLREQWNGFDSVVLVTQAEASIGHARPMAVARVDENCDLWFLTSEHSTKVKEIQFDTRAQVIAQKGWASCIIATGRAKLVRDRAMMLELWKPAFKVWFPEGVEDPNLVLIRFAGEQAEYWDNTGVNRCTYLYQALKAVVKGSTPEVKEGQQHGRVTLTR